jgi:hypothetical protein
MRFVDYKASFTFICQRNNKPVKRAVKIFSPQVTTALSYLEKYKNPDFLESQPRIELMEFMYTFFKIHDVSDKIQYFRKEEPILIPYHTSRAF